MSRSKNNDAVNEFISAATLAQNVTETAIAHFHRGLVLADVNFKESINAYTMAIANDPQYATAYYNLGTLFLQTGSDAHKAIGALAHAVHLQPMDAASRTALGSAFSAVSQHKEAVNSFQIAVQLTPQQSSAALNLAHAALQYAAVATENISATEIGAVAKHAAATAVRLAPHDAEAYMMLGRCAQHHRDSRTASDAYFTATTLAPYHKPGLLALGRTLLGRLKLTKALKVVHAAQRIAPRDTHVLRLHAHVLHRTGRTGVNSGVSDRSRMA